jgi:integral membrane protein (TIGR01906 family)
MKTIYMIISWLITICLPFLLIMTSIRILATPLFPQIEYRTPYFPADPYGFSFEERLKWSAVSIEYLNNKADISFLANQHLPDGSPLYNERELSHMVDVKTLIQKATSLWIYLILGFIVLELWSRKSGWKSTYWSGISRGGWLTIGLIILIFLAITINFDTLFTEFHRVFFQGDTWLFYFSDSLIRLFPIRFWQDSFIFMGVFTLSGGLLTALGGRKLARKSTV